MEGFAYLALALIILFHAYRYFIKGDSVEDVDNEAGRVEETSNTKELVNSVLKRLGCQPREIEDNRIQFEYQGTRFLIYTMDECLYVNLIMPWCHCCSKFDIDEFARVRRVVNDINYRATCTVFYTMTDSDEVAIHITKNFLFVPQIPQLDNYLRSILNNFFETAKALDVWIESRRLQES